MNLRIKEDGWMRERVFYILMMISVVGVWIWSAIQPADRKLWFYEMIPAVLLLLVLIFTYRSLPFTPLTYFFAWVGMIVMLIGAHYTYGGMPLFEMLKDACGFSRNHFDRVGHFLQGVLPSLFFREILIRRNLVHRSWVWFFVISISTFFSAGYEIFEFLYGRLMGENMEDFLGTQGDQWDSHWDIISAMLGSTFVLVLLSGWQDRLIQKEKQMKKHTHQITPNR
jgi:putative membrane protein